MNWTWALRRARQLSILFERRYRVRAVLEDCEGIPVWMYHVERAP